MDRLNRMTIFPRVARLARAPRTTRMSRLTWPTRPRRLPRMTRSLDLVARLVWIGKRDNWFGGKMVEPTSGLKSVNLVK